MTSADPLLLGCFSYDFFDVVGLFSTDHCYLVGVTNKCGFIIVIIIIIIIIIITSDTGKSKL